jgi:hypothetical protein
MILLSASTEDTAAELAKLTAHLARNGKTRPVVGYGGQIFSHRPELRNSIAGVYMGDNAHAAVQRVDEILLDRPRSNHTEMEPTHER